MVAGSVNGHLRPTHHSIFALSLVSTSETADAGRWVDDSGKWHKRPADAAMQRAAFEIKRALGVRYQFSYRGRSTFRMTRAVYRVAVHAIVMRHTFKSRPRVSLAILQVLTTLRQVSLLPTNPQLASDVYVRTAHWRYSVRMSGRWMCDPQ